MKSLPLLSLLLLLSLSMPSTAQVPHRLNYQGRVTTGGQNFTGNGQFKFALISADTATAYWKNDGPAGNILTPPFGITIPVQNGHYSVQLGDTSLPNMQALPPEVFTQHNDVKLRVWFSDGIHGFQALLPDQKLAAVGYAIMADDVKDGAITSAKMASGAARDNLADNGLSAVPTGGSVLSEDWNDTNLINAGYIQTGRLQTGVQDSWHQLPSAPEKRHSHTLTTYANTRLMVFGGLVEPAGGGAAAVSNTGAVFTIATQTWSAMSQVNAPSPRSKHTAVEAAGKLYIWGGSGSPAYLGDGGIYSPWSNSWVTIPATPALPARRDHSAVANGTEMICFGGEIGAGSYSSLGARYNFSTGAWTQLPIGPTSPTPRARHSAMLLGNKMIIWGGRDNAAVLNTGSVYDLTTNTWTLMSVVGAPAARAGHAVQYAHDGGTNKMYVWGGENAAGTPVSGGGVYDPTTNTWASLSADGAPGARSGATFSFTGDELLYWGGQNAATYYGGAGFIYDFSNDQWTLTDSSNSPSARKWHAADNTYANRVYVHGGTNGTSVFNDLYVWIPQRSIFVYERL